MTQAAREVALILAEQNPAHEFAYTEYEVGARKLGSGERYYPVFAATITGQWVRMETDILVNGKPIERAWVPLTAAEVNHAN